MGYLIKYLPTCNSEKHHFRRQSPINAPHSRRWRWLEPSGAKQGPSPNAANNTICAAWGQLEPSKNQARMLKIHTSSLHRSSWNQVEPSRNQAQMLQIIHSAPHGTKWNQVEPSAEPSKNVTPPTRKLHFWSPHRLLFIILN